MTTRPAPTAPPQTTHRPVPPLGAAGAGWATYEADKRHLQALDLSPQEYKQAIREIARKLRL